MWEKISKVQVQNSAVMSIIIGAFIFGGISFFVFPVEQSERIISKILDITLMGGIGWLFTQSKQKPV